MNMNQRESGHRWERELAERLSEFFGRVFKTSRAESRTKDNQKIDFVCIDCEPSFPVEFQAKEQTIKSDAKSYSIKVEALDQMQTTKKRALLVRLWKKKKTSKRRTHHGNYMVVDLEFGLELLKLWDQNSQKS